MRVLGGGRNPRFDRIVRLASESMHAPRATIALVDHDRMWVKAAVGVGDLQDWPRAGTVSALTVNLGEPIFSGDIKTDPRFAGKLGEAATDVRFCAFAPLLTTAGEAIGVLGVSDVEPRDPPSPAQQRALVDLASIAMDELQREADTRRIRRLVDGMMGLATMLTPEGRVIETNRRVKEISGENADLDGPLIWETERWAHDKACIEAIRDAVRRARRGQTVRFDAELRSFDGGRVPLDVQVSPIVDDEGEIEFLVMTGTEIAERKAAEAQRETLLAELDHRVKNLLAAVQSLAAQSARKAGSLDGFLKTFNGRLKAMASAHELLTATRWRGAAVRDIAAAELGGLAPGQTRWEGPDLTLTPRAANALSLALHELSANAVKYGALSVDQGRVEVRWRLDDGGGFELTWRESGGPTVSTPARRGFGSTLLDQVTPHELGGAVRLDFFPTGVRAILHAAPAALATPSPDRATPPPVEIAGASSGSPNAEHAARVRGLKILIVEDALLLALELGAGLTEAGAIVVGQAAEVAEALGMIDRPIDAAVLDANLNGASVRPVAEALAARNVPFVFATGYGDNRAGAPGAPDGFDAPVIRKPYDVTQVAAALAEITGRG